MVRGGFVCLTLLGLGGVVVDLVLVSQADFARHRKVSRATVTQYKQQGLLVMIDGKVDQVASDASLDSNLNPFVGGDRSSDSAKSKQVNMDLLKAKSRETAARAANQELAVLEKAGGLVRRDQVEHAAFTSARMAQQSLMAIADRLAPVLAGIEDAAEIHKQLSDELRRVCQGLAVAAKDMAN